MYILKKIFTKIILLAILVIFYFIWANYNIRQSYPVLDESQLVDYVRQKISENEEIYKALGGHKNFVDDVVLAHSFACGQINLIISLKESIDFKQIKKSFEDNLDLNSYTYKKKIFVNIYIGHLQSALTVSAFFLPDYTFELHPACQ